MNFCGGLLTVDSCPHQPKPAAGPVGQRQACAVSTVLAQRRWHPFFAGQSRDTFLARVAALPTQPSTAEVTTLWKQ